MSSNLIFLPPERRIIGPREDGIVFLSHFNGDEGSTQFVDQCGHEISVVGVPKISRVESQFDGASLALPGANAFLHVTDSPAFGFGTGEFTIELWFNPSVVNRGTQGLLDLRTPSSNQRVWMELNNGTLLFRKYGATFANAFGLKPNTWNHAAISRKGENCYAFLNGQLINGAAKDVRDLGVSSTLTIGQVGNNLGFTAGHFNGYIDEVVITKGRALYDGNFVPRTLAYPD